MSRKHWFIRPTFSWLDFIIITIGTAIVNYFFK